MEIAGSKRHGILTTGVVLFHDDTRPHTPCTATVLQEFGWELFDHPPYSPDPAISIFTLLKTQYCSLSLLISY